MNGDLRFSIGNCDCTAIFTFDKGWVQSFHYHASNEIIYIGNDNIRCFTRDWDKRIAPDTVCIIPPAKEHYFSPFSEGVAEKVSFRFSFELNKAVSDKHNMYYQFNTLFSAVDDIILIEKTDAVVMFRSLMSLVCGDYTDEFVLKNYASLILITLLKELKGKSDTALSTKNGADNIKARDFTLFSQVESYIAQHYMEKLTLKGVASELYISTRQLSRLCLRVCKMNFKDIVQNQRMMIAKQVIVNTDIALFEISERVGFDSYTGFYKCFVRYYETTPAEMRARKNKRTRYT